MQKYIYFYDLNIILIDRYPADIANKIRKISPQSKFIFIYSEKSQVGKSAKIPLDSKCFYVNDLSTKKLDEIIKLYPPNSFVSIAQRIPDMWMICYFKKKSIHTFVVQHGLWSYRLERIPLVYLMIKRIKNIFHYLLYVYNICKINNISYFENVFDYYLFLIKGGISVKDTKHLDNNSIRADTAFVFDETWDDYYIHKYGYEKNAIVYIGNPDDLLLNDVDLDNIEDAVCYLCQSLVEDGRYTKRKYMKFLKILNSSVACNNRLIIKLHPRSNMKYYDIFKNNKNVTFSRDLPVCYGYIGHYTSLLSVVSKITDNVLIWKLSEHHIPEYFYQFAVIVTESEKELACFVKEKSKKRRRFVNKKDIKDSIAIIAEKISRII